MSDVDDLLLLVPCWLCQPPAPKRFWQAGQWVASASQWVPVTKGGIGRLRHVVHHEKRPHSDYLVRRKHGRSTGSDRRLHVQWAVGSFVTATVHWLPPGCTGSRKDQVTEATPEQIEAARNQCPSCHGKAMTSITPEQALQGAWHDSKILDALRVWADRKMEVGDPIGVTVALELRRREHDAEHAPW